MIVSVQRRFVFVHIHKTAGTSLKLALEPHLRWNDLVLGGTDFGEQIQQAYLKRWQLFKHSPAHRIRRVIGRKRWERYFTFSFVRNPYARAVSLYSYLQDLLELSHKERMRRWLPWHDPRHHQVEDWQITTAVRRSADFGEFIRQPEFLEHFAHRSQRDYLIDRKSNQLIMTFIGRSENLTADFQHICKTIGIEDCSLPKANQSKRSKPWQDYYRSSADLDRVYEAFAEDFKTFDYARQLPETP